MDEPKGWMAGSAELIIDASAAKIWALLTDVKRWPEWNQRIREVRAGEDLRGGSVFSWRSGRSTVHASVMAWEPPQLFAWTATLLDVVIFHQWRLEARDGQTVVRTVIEIGGPPVRVVPRALRTILDSVLRSMPTALKAEAEKPLPR